MTDTTSLWKAYKETGDEVAREQLVAVHFPLVRYIVSQMVARMPAHVEASDLESYGLHGLLDAVDRFDPARSVRFQTYAMSRIRGSIIDRLRSDSWAPALKLKARQIDEAHMALVSTLGRAPSDEELASRLGISRNELLRRKRESAAGLLVYLDDDRSDGEDGEGISTGSRLVDPNSPNPETEALHRERKEILTRAIDQLSEKERLVVTLLYYENLTSTEAAAVMNLSVPRISQIHARAMVRLRGRLERVRQELMTE